MKTVRLRRRPRKPILPAFLIPLRNYSPKAARTLQDTKFDGNGFEHLPASMPFVAGASTCIFSMNGMTFYVPPVYYKIAKKMVAFSLETLLSISKNEMSNWRRASADMASVEFESGVIPCIVEFRSPSSDIVIRFDVDANGLVISMPHPSKWSLSGLGWLVRQ